MSAAGGVPARGRSLRVLVVDDNVDSAESMALLLQLWGHQAHIAADGQEALGLVSEHRPQVVLLDIGLPGMNGYEVARAMRALGLEPAPMLVALTGYGQDEDREAAAAAGFSVHLVKPVQPSRLEELLASLP